MAPKELILITGASGFVGAQAVAHALRAGYAHMSLHHRARAAGHLRRPALPRRSRRRPRPRDLSHALAGEPRPSVLAPRLTTLSAGVAAVLHIAAPTTLGKDHLEVAVDGTLNLLRQAHAARIRRVVLISSLAACVSLHDTALLLDPSRTIDAHCKRSLCLPHTRAYWNAVTRAEACRPDIPPFAVYAASKALGERAAWEFAAQHPEMDLLTVLPPLIFGPSAPGQVIAGPHHGLSTNRFIYGLIAGAAAAYPPESIAMTPHFVDVRDVATACVRALQAPPAPPGEKRRVLVCGGAFTWAQAVRHIAKVRPSLVARLVPVRGGGGGGGDEDATPCARIDTGVAREVLGMREFIGWEQAVADAVDSLLEREKGWGVAVGGSK
ncbi:hypothetical protein JB92DRAFT_3131509 [Gautieria morchelliformis]|nr:hypothetical protein JB92DRAFT_3131509 [Gautieria morchelliformis]